MTALPADVLKLYAPLFCEMEDSGQALSLEDFLAASGRLYESLSPLDKNTLLAFVKKSKKPVLPPPTFQVPLPANRSR